MILATCRRGSCLKRYNLNASQRRCIVVASLVQGVREIAVESARTTVLSRILRLRLSCDGAVERAPATLILKTAHPDRAGPSWNAGRQEVAFYANVGPATPAGLIPQCFEAFGDSETNAWHLLLEDLSDSYVVATTWPLPPTEAQCQVIVGALARFHAHWWDDSRLGTSLGSWRDEEATQAYLRSCADRFARFSDLLGDRLPRVHRDLYERLLAEAPRLLAESTPRHTAAWRRAYLELPVAARQA